MSTKCHSLPAGLNWILAAGGLGWQSSRRAPRNLGLDWTAIAAICPAASVSSCSRSLCAYGATSGNRTGSNHVNRRGGERADINSRHTAATAGLRLTLRGPYRTIERYRCGRGRREEPGAVDSTTRRSWRSAARLWPRRPISSFTGRIARDMRCPRSRNRDLGVRQSVSQTVSQSVRQSVSRGAA